MHQPSDKQKHDDHHNNHTHHTHHNNNNQQHPHRYTILFNELVSAPFDSEALLLAREEVGEGGRGEGGDGLMPGGKGSRGVSEA